MDVRNLLGRMRGALARNPNNKAFAAQVELLERIQHQLAITYKQRLALQTLFVVTKGRKRKCGLCKNSGSIDL